jgi:outer membrane protein OmpA-like peptidoglycan-associated protein
MREKGAANEGRNRGQSVEGKDMNNIVELPSWLISEAQKRWGGASACSVARENGRYLGAAISRPHWVLQYVAPGEIVAHRAGRITFCAQGPAPMTPPQALDGEILSIYYIAGRGVAYYRSPLVRSRPFLTPSDPRQKHRRRKGNRATVVTVAAAVATVIALAACASKNKLITPNGKERVVVNTPASLTKYQDIVARQDAMTLEKSELQRKVEMLSSQVATLKAYVVEHEKKEKQHENSAAPPPPPTPPKRVAPAPTSSPQRGSAKVAAEAVMVGGDNVTFRVSEEVGKTEFLPTPELEQTLLKAATAAKTISIRGRTDATVADDIEARIALARAVHARQFLVANGVDSTKIKTWFRAAGAFAVDNSSPEGQAVNRRVEIEARGLDTSAFTPLVTDIRVGRNQ